MPGILKILIILTLSIVLLNACGGGGDSGGNNKPPAPQNNLPIISMIEKTTQEDMSVSFSVEDFLNVFQDSDGDTLNKIIIKSLPEHGSILLDQNTIKENDKIENDQLSKLTFIPENNWYGTETFLWNACDGKACAASMTSVVIEVYAVNDSPMISNLLNQEIEEDSILDEISFTIEDIETDADQLTVTVESLNLTLVSSQQISLSGTGMNRLMTIEPYHNQSGITQISVSVYDGFSLTTGSFELTVTAIADPPKISAAHIINGYYNTWIPLNIAQPELTDIDGSEELAAVKIENIPDQCNLSTGNYYPDQNAWMIQIEDLNELAFMAPESVEKTVVLKVQVSSIEKQNQDMASQAISITLNLQKESLAIPEVKISKAAFQSDGDYQTFCNVFPCEVSGSYEYDDKQLTIQAMSENTVIHGNAINGIFHIDIPFSGNWELIIYDQSNTVLSKSTLDVLSDNTPPLLNISGESERTTDKDYSEITGFASDEQSGIDCVYVQSNHFPDQQFNAIVNEFNTFSLTIPLTVGKNGLVVTARDMMANETKQSITVTVSITEKPRVSITYPSNGTLIYDESIQVKGFVRSSLPKEQIKLFLSDQMTFAQGDSGDYTFLFNNVHLSTTGSNDLIVKAITKYDFVEAKTTVLYYSEQETIGDNKPVIEISKPGLYSIIKDQNIFISGTAKSDYGISNIVINEQIAEMIPINPTEMSFKYMMVNFHAAVIPITVTAFDQRGISETFQFDIYFDPDQPEIDVYNSSVQASPVINYVYQTPYPLSFLIKEKNIAGFSINGKNYGLLPGNTDETWTLDTAIPLVRNEKTTIDIQAWDVPGNRTDMILAFQLETHIDIDMIKPLPDEVIQTSQDKILMDISAAISGQVDTDMVSIQMDQLIPVIMNVSNSIASASISISATQGLHTFTIKVVNSENVLLMSQTESFNINNLKNTPLTVIKQEPENNTINVEPNDFIAFYFNKSINPEMLTISVTENAHGEIYSPTRQGAEFTEMSDIKRLEVHRENEPVPGGLSYFPNNIMTAFFPKRDYAYGGQVYVTLTYENEILWRSSFQVRPLPTLIQGFVADQFMIPLEGIDVYLPKLDKISQTDINGCYGFGYGKPADQSIPEGRYLAIVNPELKNSTYGSLEFWINVEAGYLNKTDVKMIPVLNPEVPFVRIKSHQNIPAILAANELIMDLKDTQLSFPDGRNEGDIHVQFMKLNQIGYQCFTGAMPHWAFVIHPSGIEVSGNLQLTFTIPDLYESFEYISNLPEYVLLVGFDPKSLQIVPVGGGQMDKQTNTVSSVGLVHLKRLDYLGYALMPEKAQPLLIDYINGEIDIRQLIGEIDRLSTQ